MQRTTESWLLAACDPLATAATTRSEISPTELQLALEAAKRHFVLGSVLRSVGIWQLAHEVGCDAVVRPLAEFHMRDAGRTLGLRHLAQQTVRALAAATVPCCILKGEDFATRLYSTPALRPYRDVDVLVPQSHFAEADRVIQSLGFAPLTPDRKYAAEDYGQISYVAKTAEQWSVELHWNVINSPAQRRRCSIAWEDFAFESIRTSEGCGALASSHRLAPASLLVLAAVHACVGHRFDSLQQLCDIRQICRGAAGPVDVDDVSEMCRRLRCETPVAWALDLIVRMFDCPAARALVARRRFSRRVVRAWGVLGPQTVLRPQSASSKLRRSVARLRLKNAA